VWEKIFRSPTAVQPGFPPPPPPLLCILQAACYKHPDLGHYYTFHGLFPPNKPNLWLRLFGMVDSSIFFRTEYYRLRTTQHLHSVKFISFFNRNSEDHKIPDDTNLNISKQTSDKIQQNITTVTLNYPNN
jgi:hypothetical protein